MATKKWGKEPFMEAFFKNSGNKHKSWGAFHKAMNAESKKATGGTIDELRLALRCGSINRYLREAKMKEWNFPPRPKKTPPKPPSVADIAKRIVGEKPTGG